jgi:hypothetical protein
VKNKIIATSCYIAMACLIGGLGVAGCAPDSTTTSTQASEQSHTSTSSQGMPVSSSKTTSVRNSSSTN